MERMKTRTTPRETVAQWPAMTEPSEPARRHGMRSTISATIVIAALIAAVTTFGLINWTTLGRADVTAHQVAVPLAHAGSGATSWAEAIARAVGPPVGEVDVTGR